MTALVFADTNVLVYHLDTREPRNQSHARAWVEYPWTTRSGRISFQVLAGVWVRGGEAIASSTRLPGSLAVYPSHQIGYTSGVGKRLVDIDDDLLERARSVAGTGTIKDTVHAALERLVDDERVRRHVERLRGSGALDPAQIEEARRPRIAR